MSGEKRTEIEILTDDFEDFVYKSENARRAMNRENKKLHQEISSFHRTLKNNEARYADKIRNMKSDFKQLEDKNHEEMIGLHRKQEKHQMQLLSQLNDDKRELKSRIDNTTKVLLEEIKTAEADMQSYTDDKLLVQKKWVSNELNILDSRLSDIERKETSLKSIVSKRQEDLSTLLSADENYKRYCAQEVKEIGGLISRSVSEMKADTSTANGLIISAYNKYTDMKILAEKRRIEYEYSIIQAQSLCTKAISKAANDTVVNEKIKTEPERKIDFWMNGQLEQQTGKVSQYQKDIEKLKVGYDPSLMEKTLIALLSINDDIEKTLMEANQKVLNSISKQRITGRVLNSIARQNGFKVLSTNGFVEGDIRNDFAGSIKLNAQDDASEITVYVSEKDDKFEISTNFTEYFKDDHSRLMIEDLIRKALSGDSTVKTVGEIEARESHDPEKVGKKLAQKMEPKAKTVKK